MPDALTMPQAPPGGSETVDRPDESALLAKMKEAARAVFSLGDYRKIAETLEDASRQTVLAAVAPGDRVLDVAAGTGNAAVQAARAGARVVACDLTPRLAAWGNERSLEESLQIGWAVADAEQLPFPDASFDCAISVLGASMAPRPPVVASELFRVIRPGGKVGTANWTSDCFPMRMGAIVAGHLGMPPPKGSERAVWGEEDRVKQLFAPWAANVCFQRRVMRMKHDSFEEYLEFNQVNFGFLVAAQKRLPAKRFHTMMAEIGTLARQANSAPNGAVAIDCEYLIATAQKA